MNAEQVAKAEAQMLAALVAAGRRAAALDGRHLLGWGLLSATCLGAQYLAETRDWLPSRLLWWWQPMLLGGFVLAMFVGHRGAGRRLGHPVSRGYALTFLAAGVGLLVYLLVAGGSAVPPGLTTALILCAGLGTAFLVLALATPLRWMLLPSAGWWWLLTAFHSAGAVVPLDWLRLAVACLALIALPGAVLIWKAPR